MKNITINVLLFTTGAVIGSLVTWKVVKTKYERIAQEEIDSVKETWARLMRDRTSERVEEESEDYDESDEEEDDGGYAQQTFFEYSSLANMYKNSGEKTENGEEGERDDEVPYVNGPYVISPEDYGDGEYDHDLQCLTYYADGVLADDWGVKLDVEDTIGEDSIAHFGDYEEDILHIRNERNKRDYEIVRDSRTYAEANS